MNEWIWNMWKFSILNEKTPKSSFHDIYIFGDSSVYAQIGNKKKKSVNILH